MGMQKYEVETICAGVTEEHFHVTCNRCHFLFLQHILPGPDLAEELAEAKNILRERTSRFELLNAEFNTCRYERSLALHVLEQWLHASDSPDRADGPDSGARREAFTAYMSISEAVEVRKNRSQQLT